ncbi:MAG: DNA mismatch repair endonuclease MutL [Candidatus Fimisoma sp.]
MIRVLDKQIADKIAAGEVIERPVSIIKELVENSIDAGADSIVVEIKKGGKSYIRVTDNGQGIAHDETEKAFLRHATSKISTVRDLNSIQTLGFRGEALASICAVTRTELLTKRLCDKTGTRLILHGGEVVSYAHAGCPDGTTVVITDLFYNTPARLKFMKSDSAESTMIIDLMSQMALAYKDISFRLINNGNVLFSTSGDGNRLSIISRIFPGIDIRNLVEVDCVIPGISLKGLVSTPAMTRTGKNAQIFFVNGRVVNSKVIEKGITEGYRERLFDGRHPIAFLFLEINPEDLDVNIHPNKKEVRFNDERFVEEFISKAIKEALGSKEAVVRAADAFRESYENKAAFRSQEEVVSVKEEQFNFKNIMSTVSDDVAYFVQDVETPPVFNDFAGDNKSEGISEDTIILEKPIHRPFDFDQLQIKGSLFDTYIMATDNDCFYLIDQHAAHERVFYEKLVSEYDAEEKVRQPILVPVILDVDISASASDEWLEILCDMGYTIENFGQNSYRISEIPTFMDLSEAENFARDFADNVTAASATRNSVVINKLIMKSCKSAVKANDILNPEEIDALIKDLKQCVNPFSCPHGRPTFIKLSKYEIERLFKRV